MNLDYQAVLADLEQRKAGLEAGIAAIKRIAVWLGYIKNSEPTWVNVTAETLRFLSERPSESFFPAEIAAGIGCARVETVRGATFRHIRKGTLRKDENGRVSFIGATEENRDV